MHSRAAQTDLIKEPSDKLKSPPQSFSQFASLALCLFRCIHIIKLFAFVGVQLHRSRSYSNGIASSNCNTDRRHKLNQETTDRKRGTAVQRMGSASVQD